jgi:putative FmdB family regulatory protein
MPLYEYRCTSCGRRFEALVSVRAASTPACPSCDSDSVEKQYSTFGFGNRSGGSGHVPVTFSGG